MNLNFLIVLYPQKKLNKIFQAVYDSNMETQNQAKRILTQPEAVEHINNSVKNAFNNKRRKYDNFLKLKQETSPEKYQRAVISSRFYILLKR